MDPETLLFGGLDLLAEGGKVNDDETDYGKKNEAARDWEDELSEGSVEEENGEEEQELAAETRVEQGEEVLFFFSFCFLFFFFLLFLTIRH